MEQNKVQITLRALLGLVETFLIMHGGLNILGTYAVRDTAFAFAVCGALVAVLLLVWPAKLRKG